MGGGLEITESNFVCRHIHIGLIESLKLPKFGSLAKNPTGLVFIDLDDQWIAGLQTELRQVIEYNVVEGTST